jgi:phenylalanyl-tRNA synthetase beta subunit
MGFIESLTFGLVSKDENYTFFRKKFNEDEAITLANPATIEF